MPFAYQRTIRFADTDAAGVVFFPNYFAICHEAYEESLAAAGIELKTFFTEHWIFVPVSRCHADYLRPLSCGDKVSVTLAPMLLGAETYAINYELHLLGLPEKLVARLRTEHVCISARSRERHALPAALTAWLKACSA